MCVYNKIPKKYFPFRRLKQIDSKLEKFGRSPDDSTKFKGRRIDIMMRAVNQKDLSKLFKYPRTKSFELWSRKAVIGIYPNDILGKIIYQNKTT